MTRCLSGPSLLVVELRIVNLTNCQIGEADRIEFKTFKSSKFNSNNYGNQIRFETILAYIRARVGRKTTGFRDGIFTRAKFRVGKPSGIQIAVAFHSEANDFRVVTIVLKKEERNRVRETSMN